MHDVTHRGDEVDTKLRQVSTDLSQFISAHVQQNLDLMLKTTDKQVIVDIYSNNEYLIVNIFTFCLASCLTPPRSPRISRLKSQIMKPTFLS